MCGAGGWEVTLSRRCLGNGHARARQRGFAVWYTNVPCVAIGVSRASHESVMANRFVTEQEFSPGYAGMLRVGGYLPAEGESD